MRLSRLATAALRSRTSADSPAARSLRGAASAPAATPATKKAMRGTRLRNLDIAYCLMIRFPWKPMQVLELISLVLGTYLLPRRPIIGKQCKKRSTTIGVVWLIHSRENQYNPRADSSVEGVCRLGGILSDN